MLSPQIHREADMFVLMFLVMINGHTDRYVVDYNLTADDCRAAVANVRDTDRRYRDVRIHTAYRCVKVR